jgi:hypothetical protein
MTKGKITENKAKPEHKIVEWMTKERAEAIMKKYPDARESGIWIATKTYTTKARALAVLQSKEASATFGVDLNLWSIATVAPSVEWWNSQKDSMWVMHENVSFCSFLRAKMLEQCPSLEACFPSLQCFIWA